MSPLVCDGRAPARRIQPEDPAHRDGWLCPVAAVRDVVARGAPRRRRARLQPFRPATSRRAPLSPRRADGQRPLRHRPLPACGAAARAGLPQSSRHRRRRVGDPGGRRRHGDDRRPPTGLGAHPVEPPEIVCRLVRAVLLRRACGCVAGLVVPAERDAGPGAVVLGRGTVRRGARRRVRRDDPRQARRQSLGSGLGRGGALGAVARSEGSRRTGDRGWR